MKRGYLRSFVYLVGFAAIVILLSTVSPALAGEEGSEDWRKTYDVVMMWVNFLILVGGLYWLLRKPMADFVQGRKKETEKELQRAEDQKNMAEAKILEAKAMVAEGKERFSMMKERIIAQGQKGKEELILEAEEMSRFMMAEAQRKIDSMLLHAKEKLRKEILDEAFDLALEKLPSEVTDEDNQKYVDKFISSLAA